MTSSRDGPGSPLSRGSATGWLRMGPDGGRRDQLWEWAGMDTAACLHS
jgi:hypothetical protein